MNPTQVTSRREFLKTSGTAVAGAALAATLATPRAGYCAEDNAIKIALVGCGGRGTGAAANALSTKGPVEAGAIKLHAVMTGGISELAQHGAAHGGIVAFGRDAVAVGGQHEVAQTRLPGMGERMVGVGRREIKLRGRHVVGLRVVATDALRFEQPLLFKKRPPRRRVVRRGCRNNSEARQQQGERREWKS